jgi:protein TonB
MEYYLALRDKAPTDPAVASALTDLMPYALIATEQSIQREDFTEAQRLYALMEKTDYQAPALPRLKKTIADAQTALAARTEQDKVKAEQDTKTKADLEKQRVAQQAAAQQAAAQQLAAQQAQQDADRKATADREAAQQKAATQQAAAPAPAQQTASAPSAPARARRCGGLTAVSTPAPRYPPKPRVASRAAKCRWRSPSAPTARSPARASSTPPRRASSIREALGGGEAVEVRADRRAGHHARTINFRPGG